LARKEQFLTLSIIDFFLFHLRYFINLYNLCMCMFSALAPKILKKALRYSHKAIAAADPRAMMVDATKGSTPEAWLALSCLKKSLVLSFLEEDSGTLSSLRFPFLTLR
jgi:hypothetical protein